MSFEDEMRVMKRNGNYETISFDKILHRVRKVGTEANVQINYTPLVMKIIDQLYDGIDTSKIDELTAEQCASQITQHPDFGKLGSHLIISNHHKNTKKLFVDVMNDLYNFKDVNNKHSALLSKSFIDDVNSFDENVIENIIDYNRDYLIDYFGFKTLERAYLFKINSQIVERPQHMWMRVAIGIHGRDIENITKTYNYMSKKYFTHATPTLFNAGTPRPQMSSCYLLSMEDDSVTGIYNTLTDCANISKYAGGIGLHIHNVRATGSHIRGTNGISNGIVPMLRVYNNTARYIDQGGGKRNGSFAIYLEPWHGDIEQFLEMRKNHGDEEARARDLFYALWIPDLFMKRVHENAKWTLMCPDECPGLSDVYGNQFVELYEKYESENKGKKQVSARDLWFKILDSQMETGTPYLLYKDAANQKSNQKNLGTIKSSNLCTEIIEYSDNTETAVCNLASIALSAFVKHKQFDFDELYEVTQTVTYNLNKIIDLNFYPTPKTQKSNMRHRPIGIGIQGLADAFAMLDIPFHSDEASKLNEEIFETIYYASMEMSNKIAQERSKLLDSIDPSDRYGENGLLSHLCEYETEHLKKSYKGAYSTFEGSPLSEGKFQFDLWNKKPLTNRYDWNRLRDNIMFYGVRNSLLVAPMPTASTSQILGNNECFEPFTSNIYSRSTLAGEFMLVNKHMMNDLFKINMWNNDIKNSIIANKGSIQQIEEIPQLIKDKYKTVWEIPMKHIINMAADRGKYICQSQSLNLWQEEPTYNSLTSMHFYTWKTGLKTGIYYLRRRAKHQAQQFTIDPNKENIKQEDEICEMCSG
uniref:ribonucleoside-diphosphate reductase n=1 Tax=viral metagenome TaxID=1070528 RepID=A0A6C0AXF4_9ZZZZ|tara:strand:- start:4374 stop:6809 length:2436 start_codon:yes stop_codon:yes gene_type:complete